MHHRVLYLLMPISGGVVAILLFSAGLWLAVSKSYGEPLGSGNVSRPTPEVKASERRSQEWRIVLLGDSVAAGVGDTVEGGLGARLAQLLRERGTPASFRNLAVGGYETSELLSQLSRPETQRLVREANLILVSIGGNDLSHAVRPDLRSTGLGKSEALALVGARKNLDHILSQLRALSPDAPIRIVGLYNPYEIAPEGVVDAQEILLRWNVAIQEAALRVPGVIVVPVADLFLARRDYLATDDFHPGPKGYQEIARRAFTTLPGQHKP
jgi:lysophospholipase L1-like esterase